MRNGIRRFFWAVAVMLTGGLLAMSFSGCKNGDPKPETAASEPEPGVMLVDYYDAVVGTDGGDRHTECVLYTYDQANCRLSVFVQDSPEEPETETVYLVPAEARQRAYEAINDAGLKSWVDLDDGVALDGRRTVVKFKDGDGYVRCSTDNMPEDGERLLDSVGAVLRGYAKEEYLAGSAD